jgi:hypothetical protein
MHSSFITGKKNNTAAFEQNDINHPVLYLTRLYLYSLWQTRSSTYPSTIFTTTTTMTTNNGSDSTNDKRGTHANAVSRVVVLETRIRHRSVTTALDHPTRPAQTIYFTIDPDNQPTNELRDMHEAMLVMDDTIMGLTEGTTRHGSSKKFDAAKWPDEP